MLTDEEFERLSGHSPLPWDFEILDDDEGGNPAYRISADRTLFVEFAECSDGYRPGENEINARLLFAAPEMLAELRELRAKVKRLEAENAAFARTRIMRHNRADGSGAYWTIPCFGVSENYPTEADAIAAARKALGLEDVK